MPFSATSIAPSTVMSTCFPRIIAKDSEDEKMDEPGRHVTVSFPALIRSGSAMPSSGYGPIPIRPFSDCSSIVTPSGR